MNKTVLFLHSFREVCCLALLLVLIFVLSGCSEYSKKIYIKCYKGAFVSDASASLSLDDAHSSRLLVDYSSFKKSNGQLLEELVCLKITNNFLEPITVMMWGLGYKEGGYLVAPVDEEDSLPVVLDADDSCTLWVSKDKIFECIRKDRKTPNFIFVTIQDGTVFKKPVGDCVVMEGVISYDFKKYKDRRW